MENISNQEIDSDKCTKCHSCGKASWYVMKCDCGKVFCQHCSAEKSENTDTIITKCPLCGKSHMYV